jgi:hypothetical protein
MMVFLPVRLVEDAQQQLQLVAPLLAQRRNVDDNALMKQLFDEGVALFDNLPGVAVADAPVRGYADQKLGALEQAQSL